MRPYLLSRHLSLPTDAPTISVSHIFFPDVRSYPKPSDMLIVLGPPTRCIHRFGAILSFISSLPVLSSSHFTMDLDLELEQIRKRKAKAERENYGNRRAALDQLQRCIPDLTDFQREKMTEINVLRLAARYISFLRDSLKEPLEENQPSEMPSFKPIIFEVLSERKSEVSLARQNAMQGRKRKRADIIVENKATSSEDTPALLTGSADFQTLALAYLQLVANMSSAIPLGYPTPTPTPPVQAEPTRRGGFNIEDIISTT